MKMSLGALMCLTCLAIAGPAGAQGAGFDDPVDAPFGEAPLGGGVIVERGWSVEAFWIGVASALGVLTTGILSVTLGDPSDRSGSGFGATSMGVLSLAGPTVALGAASARGHPYAPGAWGARVAAWITWSLSVVSGALLLISDIDTNDAQRAAFMAPVAIGAVSLILFAFDALVGAIQADLISGRQ